MSSLHSVWQVRCILVVQLRTDTVQVCIQHSAKGLESSRRLKQGML